MDLLSKEGRKERALQKACAKAADHKIKPDDRRPALYTLLDDGGEEAVTALIKRFTFIYDSNIVNDEDEKTLVYEGLVKMGDRILPQIKKHLHSSPTLSWGLRLLNDVCDHETTWQVLDEVLADYEPGYERDPTRKLQLIAFLGEFKDARVAAQIVPYLKDHDETVRFTTVESLLKQKAEEAREPLLELMTSEEEESGRIKHRIAEGFVEEGWLVKGFRGTVEKLVGTLLTDFIVDGKGRLRRKKPVEEP